MPRSKRRPLSPATSRRRASVDSREPQRTPHTVQLFVPYDPNGDQAYLDPAAQQEDQANELRDALLEAIKRFQEDGRILCHRSEWVGKGFALAFSGTFRRHADLRNTLNQLLARLHGLVSAQDPISATEGKGLTITAALTDPPYWVIVEAGRSALEQLEPHEPTIGRRLEPPQAIGRECEVANDTVSMASARFRVEIAQALGQIRIAERINEWLGRLAGRKFPVATAEADIQAILDTVKCANLRLSYRGQLVALYPQIQARATHAKIRLCTIGVTPRRWLWEKNILPRLRAVQHPAPSL